MSPATSDQPALAAQDLSFAFDRAPVLRQVSAAFAPARVTAIVGPNGAGKTTLLRLLLGLIAPDSGTAALDHTPVAAIPTPIRARRLAFVPQRPDAAFGFTVQQTVAFARHAAAPNRQHNADAVARALLRLELADRAQEPFAHLSIGQQQRAALARALAQLDQTQLDQPQPASSHARYLIADEPISAMDPRHAAHALALMRTLAHTHSIGVVLVLHDLTAARATADDALLLTAAGRVAAQGPADHVLTPAQLEPVFETPFLELSHPSLQTPALVPAAPPSASFSPMGSGPG